jgi:hypothetical protein
MGLRIRCCSGGDRESDITDVLTMEKNGATFAGEQK